MLKFKAAQVITKCFCHWDISLENILHPRMIKKFTLNVVQTIVAVD